jgi:spermidine/putrescine transport system ATP-binding protein
VLWTVRRGGTETAAPGGRTGAVQATADSQRPIVELIEVTKRYGDTIALDRVSLAIAAGEFFCLLGPSGCGKTTTLNLIGGFIPVSEGELRIAGQRVNHLPPHRRNVNTVFQNYALFPHLTVFENVAFGLRVERRPEREVRRAVMEYLELVGLESLADRYPAQLSGGQQQRVALARALVKQPAVLLLDEPLGALDLKLRKQMQVELTRIHRQVKTTFVFVTHDQGEALSMATRIAVMNGGRVIQVGTPREIYYQPVDRFVADFIGESNLLPGKIEGGDEPGVVHLDDGTLIRAQPSPKRGRVSVMVRPEALQVGPTAPPGTAALSGRVVGVAFLGDHTRVTVRTALGELVSCRWHAGRDAAGAWEGVIDQEVEVWWDPTEAAVLSADGDERRAAGGERTEEAIP